MESTERKLRIGQLENLEIYVADPYIIALSKLDRGFDTDCNDIIFLIQQNLISLKELQGITRDTCHMRGNTMFTPIYWII